MKYAIMIDLTLLSVVLMFSFAVVFTPLNEIGMLVNPAEM